MTDIEIQTRLATNIKNFRKEQKLSQEKLSELADMSPESIKSIELMRSWVSEKSLAAIATALNVDVYQLFLPVPSSFQIESEIKDHMLSTARTSFSQFLETLKESL